MQHDLIQRIARIAARSDGRVSLAQMRAAGASTSWIARQVEAGWLQRMGRGEYLVGACTIAYQRRAAVGSGGAGAMIVGAHGLAMWRIREQIEHGEPIRVWAPTHRRSRPGAQYTHVPWIRGSDRRSIGGIAVARREICIASVAATTEAIDLVALIKEGCFRDKYVANHVGRVLQDRRFRGAPRLATALDWYLNGHCGFDSATERRVRKRLRELGAPDCVVNARLRLRDGSLRVDLYWREAGCVLEVNPDGHKRVWVRNTDLGRRARMEREGLDVIDLDTTRSIEEQDRVLRMAVERARQLSSGPLVDYVLPSRR